MLSCVLFLAARFSAPSEPPAEAAVRKLLLKVGTSTLEQVMRSQRLEWYNKGLDAGDAKVVAHVIAISPELRELAMGSNSVGDEGAAAIAEALKVNCCGRHVLSLLSLNANAIGDEGAVALGDALRENAVLTNISLAGNAIGDRGAAAIAAGLKASSDTRERMTRLTELDLYHNRIGDEGAVAIAEALGGNKVLTLLDVRHNAIGAAGGMAMAKALKVNVQLAELHIAANKIGRAGEEELKEVTRGRKCNVYTSTPRGARIMQADWA
mmetsp:Transcript_18795/g.38258  ORF Transcript_18795/g.38258 Transcript_18795/m.38258 type:complete len:267 (+) Transcript_18795:89-889(+)